jgi:Protein of unknown function (DUF1353)
MDQVTKPSRFFDVKTNGPIQLQLQQDGAEFRVVRQFGYRDPHNGETYIVPADPERFTTDLASIPALFVWLVPGLGTHLPAVVLHDGLVVPPGCPPTHIGPKVDREKADRILRDAMASLGTPRIRRWLMWTGVMLATAWSTLRPRWWWPPLVAVTIGLVAVLGLAATLDLLDVWQVLPWMGDRPWWAELAGGAAFAVLIPLLFSSAWGRRWPVGAITGVALAFLLHVTIVLFGLLVVYWVAEWLVSRPEGTGPDVSENLERATAGSAD